MEDHYYYDAGLEDDDLWWKNDPYNWVTSRVAVGGDDYLDSPEVAGKMLAEGITHAIDCRIEANRDHIWFRNPELAEATKGLFTYLLNGTDDDFQPKGPEYFRPAIEFGLLALQDRDAKLYVHCAAGYNRGPSVAFAILRAAGMTSQEAEAAIRGSRSVGLAYLADANRAVQALGYDRPKKGAKSGKRKQRRQQRPGIR